MPLRGLALSALSALASTLVTSAGCKASSDPPPAGEARPAAPVDLSGPCPALSVTVDGVPLTGLSHGQAVTLVNAGQTTQLVNLFDHDQATCEEALAGRHPLRAGEHYVKAFHSAAPGVGIETHTQLEGTLTLDRMATKVGEPVEICVRRPVVFTPGGGAYEGKLVSIVGKFAGAWCGSNRR